MAIVDRRRQQIVDTVVPRLEVGETFQGIVGFAQTGPSPWGLVLTYLVAFFNRYYGIAITDRHAFLVKRTTMLAKVKGVERTDPRASVRLVDWKPGNLWSKLVLDWSGQQLKLNVPKVHREEAAAVAAVLAPAGSPTAHVQES